MASVKICLILLLAVFTCLPTGECRRSIGTYTEDGYTLQVVIENGRPKMVPYHAIVPYCIMETDGIAPEPSVIYNLTRFQHYAKNPVFNAIWVGWVPGIEIHPEHSNMGVTGMKMSSTSYRNRGMIMTRFDTDPIVVNGRPVLRPLVCMVPPKPKLWYVYDRCHFEVQWPYSERFKRINGTFPMRLNNIGQNFFQRLWNPNPYQTVKDKHMGPFCLQVQSGGCECGISYCREYNGKFYGANPRPEVKVTVPEERIDERLIKKYNDKYQPHVTRW